MLQIRYFIFFCLTVFSSVCFAQNKLNKKGQAYGHWVFDKATYGFSEEGDYKIVSLMEYDSVHLEQTENSTVGHMNVKYKSGKASVTTYNFSEDSATVNDGTWNMYDTATGKLLQSIVYTNGIELSRKEYEDGRLVRHSYTNYDADSTVYLTYFGGHLFKKEFYPPGNSIDKRTVYYPNDSLFISNAEPIFNVNFRLNPTCDTTIKLVARSKMDIKNITATEKLKILCKNDH